MAFKEIASLDAETTIALGGQNKKTGKKNPTSVEGYYLGSKEVDSPKSKNGKAFIHILQTDKGNVGVWGKTDLDRKVRTVEAGTMVRLSFDKMTPTKNGDMYIYKVEVDSDNTTEVSSTTARSASYSEESTSYGNDEEVEESEDDEDTRQAVALSALERKAKVEALLKSKTTGQRK